jgi:hypothetical protein
MCVLFAGVTLVLCVSASAYAFFGTCLKQRVNIICLFCSVLLGSCVLWICVWYFVMWFNLFFCIVLGSMVGSFFYVKTLHHWIRTLRYRYRYPSVSCLTALSKPDPRLKLQSLCSVCTLLLRKFF